MKLTFDLTREELGALIPVLKAGALNNYLDTVFIEGCYTTPGKEFTLVCILKELVLPAYFGYKLGLEIGKNIKQQLKNNEPWNR